MIKATETLRRIGSGAVDGHGERGADLPHPVVAEPTESVDEHTERHTLDGVEVDHTHQRHWVRARFEGHLAR